MRHDKFAEEILVIKRHHLMSATPWTGLKKIDMSTCQALIRTHQEYHPRGLMEEDPTYKQIIPYLIFMHHDQLFVMQRAAHASEQRLQSKYSIGIGGHVRKTDLAGATIFDWAQREFHEEVAYHGNLTITPLGLLNDDSNEVGRVHLGLVLLLRGDRDQITIKSELQSGSLMSREQLNQYHDQMENWSKIILPYV